jgi:hypothetical protein
MNTAKQVAKGQQPIPYSDEEFRSLLKGQYIKVSSGPYILGPSESLRPQALRCGLKKWAGHHP